MWDSWFARDGDLWHAYYLQADKSIGDPEQRHWNVSYGHATSRDLVTWDHLGTCFTPWSRLGRLHDMDGVRRARGRRAMAPVLHRNKPRR
ncbi:MAG: hypothetical protein AAGA87_01210 [Pseudomonadota bacterium]